MRLHIDGPVRHAFIPELRVDGKPLGRHIAHDERSHDYPADTAGSVVSVCHRAEGLPLNQGDVGSCTAEAETGAGNAQPNLPAGQAPRTQADAYELYHEETVLEKQPWPPNDPGGSGLMVCRAAKRMGLLKSYRHAFGLEHALRALVLRPVMFGVAWFEGFDRPDANGVVSISGSIRGGHEICALRIVAEHELVGFAQSWDEGFGVPDPEMGLPRGGAFYMTFATVNELLRQQGDATVPIFI